MKTIKAHSVEPKELKELLEEEISVSDVADTIWIETSPPGPLGGEVGVLVIVLSPSWGEVVFRYGTDAPNYDWTLVLNHGWAIGSIDDLIETVKKISIVD